MSGGLLLLRQRSNHIAQRLSQRPLVADELRDHLIRVEPPIGLEHVGKGVAEVGRGLERGEVACQVRHRPKVSRRQLGDLLVLAWFAVTLFVIAVLFGAPR